MVVITQLVVSSTLISRFPKFRKSSPRIMSSSSSLSFNINNNKPKQQLPILLFDVMDTIVRDPFYHDVPSFFRMSFKELIDSKHPTAWIEFEKGLIDEMELARKFFKDGRPFDLEGLKDCMQRGYSYLDGVEELLHSLKQNGYEIHAATNYPIWYKLIEDKLKLSSYLSWTFCSCSTGKRKPDADFYLQILRHLDVNGESCIFIDDRWLRLCSMMYPPHPPPPKIRRGFHSFRPIVDTQSGFLHNVLYVRNGILGICSRKKAGCGIQNVDAAVKAGLVGLHFKNANLLHQDFSLLGIPVNENCKKQDVGELEQEHLP